MRINVELAKDAYQILAGIPASRITFDWYLFIGPKAKRKALNHSVFVDPRGTSVREIIVKDRDTKADPIWWLSLHDRFEVDQPINGSAEVRKMLRTSERGMRRLSANRRASPFDRSMPSEANDKQIALNRFLRAIGWRKTDARTRAMQDGAK